jgi:hypothetical protein
MVSREASYFVLYQVTWPGAESSVRLSRFFHPFPHHLGCHSSSPFPTGLASIFVSYVSQQDFHIEFTLPVVFPDTASFPLVRFRAVIDWNSRAGG